MTRVVPQQHFVPKQVPAASCRSTDGWSNCRSSGCTAVLGAGCSSDEGVFLSEWCRSESMTECCKDWFPMCCRSKKIMSKW